MLLRSIIGQQLSIYSAAAIHNKFLNHFGKKAVPEKIVETPHERLRSLGLSNAKVKYIKDLSEKVIAGEIKFKGLGKKHDVKTVADGFALNSLIPSGAAEVATDGVIKRVEKVKKQEEAERKIKEDLLAKNIKSIHDAVVEIALGANDKGHLFAGLHAEDIAPLVKASTGIDILPEFIKLDKPVKEVGEHKIDVNVQGKSATFTLKVTAK